MTQSKAVSPSERLRRASVGRSSPASQSTEGLRPPASPVSPMVADMPANSVPSLGAHAGVQSMIRVNPDLADPPQVNFLEQARRRAAAALQAPKVIGAAVAPVAPVSPIAEAPAPAPMPVPAAAPAPRFVAPVMTRPEKVQKSVVVAPPVVQTEIAKKQRSALANLRAAIAATPVDGSLFSQLAAQDPGDFGDRGDQQFERGGAGSGGRFERAQAPLEDIEGVLATIKEFNGWAVGTLMTTERVEVRITGESLLGLTEGLDYAFKGRPTNHASYGEGFEVVSAQPIIPANDDAVERFLVKSFKGIGKVKAAKYVKSVRDESGDEGMAALRHTLLNEPWNLDLSAISKDAAFTHGEDAQEQAKILMVTRNIMLRLGGPHGMREKTAKSLASHLLFEVTKEHGANKDKTAPINADIVSQTWAKLMQNPYAPISKTEGYGFAMAELVAKLANIPKDSALRLAALVEYAVDEGCQRKGHMFLRPSDFMESIRKIDPTAPAQLALTHALAQKLVVFEDNRVYSPRLLAAEKSLALGLAKLLQPATPLTKRSVADVKRKLMEDAAEINPAFADGFDEDQLEALAQMLTSPQRLHVFTGGPGTGKTAMYEAAIYLLKNKSFESCAPTGKAAKVMSKRIARFGYTASTINSLLKGGEQEGFKVNADEPLSCDVLVVDETTMCGSVNSAALLAALPPDAHLIVMGDPGLPAKANVPGTARAGQLPSISPGRVMQDMLLLPGVNHMHLSKTFRNSGGILEVINEVATGELKTVDRAAVRFSHGLPEPEIGFPKVMQEYLECVQRDGVENTILVMPKRKGDRDTTGWNTTFSNQVLRQTCNPHGEKLPGTTLHLGDRIIVRENMKIEQPKRSEMGAIRTIPKSAAPFALDFNKLNEDVKKRHASEKDALDAFFERSDFEDDAPAKEERVVNGDTGTIIAYAMSGSTRRLGSPQWVRLALDDGREVEFPGAEISSLDHSYAITVHSAQGSECKNVIMVVTPGSPEFMNQNMLLTGFSRAQQSLSIHGDDATLKKIAKTPMPPRNSGLVERVQLAMAQVDAAIDESDDAPKLQEAA